jgi:hypothetical protein
VKRSKIELNSEFVGMTWRMLEFRPTGSQGQALFWSASGLGYEMWRLVCINTNWKILLAATTNASPRVSLELTMHAEGGMTIIIMGSWKNSLYL